MTKYKNLSGNSGVYSYEYGNDYIRVEFTSGGRYLYTDSVTGSENVSCMKELADAGEGLATFISRNVRKKYAKKEK